MDKLPITDAELQSILACFQLEPAEVTSFCDSSHGIGDIRWNLIFEDKYVLKINARKSMWEDRLQEISRLIDRYRSIGVYCPAMIPAKTGKLSCDWERDGTELICFVEEYAKYPAYGWNVPHERKAVVEHLGLLAARYTNVDLSSIHSMWSIIDLSPLDVDVDEKQENADMLIAALRTHGNGQLADQVDALNRRLRQTILAHFSALPRCVFQGDLNSTNELHDHGRFVGLIDFNCSGTDVSINVFANETNWFPEEEAFDRLSIPEILEKMERESAELASAIFRHYAMNDLEKWLYPYFQRIANLFQYPNVCAMVKWLKDENRREKCVGLIQAMTEAKL